MAALDHIDIVVRSLERSLPFYRDLVGPLGWRWSRLVVGEQGETIHYLFAANGRSSIGIREAISQSEDDYDRYRPGLHHLAFAARTRRRVDERADWLRSIDATIESGPARHDYTPGYYALFFKDPDGMKLEIVYRPPARTLLWSINPRTTPFRTPRG